MRPRGPPVTAILPFLYLGNQEGAADEDLIDRLSIKYVLNMTPVCPNYFIQKADMHYKQIKICDSNQADIGQYFDEAFKFIGRSRLMLHEFFSSFLHCQQGAKNSGSATATRTEIVVGFKLIINGYVQNWQINN